MIMISPCVVVSGALQLKVIRAECFLIPGLDILCSHWMARACRDSIKERGFLLVDLLFLQELSRIVLQI